MEKDITKKYSNGEITIVWKPKSCIHSTLCWKKDTGLSQVFNPSEQPWIKPEGSTTDKIIEHVKKCPSGALSFYYNNEMEGAAKVSAETKVEAVLNGPLLVYGNVVIKDTKGNEIKKNNVTAFCRCGQSTNKPYCDGSHVKNNFEG
jgi:uncharacterized Fe-S cluster protein YjdI